MSGGKGALVLAVGLLLAGAGAGALLWSLLNDDPDPEVMLIAEGVSYPEGPARFEPGVTIAHASGGLSEPICTGDGVAVTVRIGDDVTQSLIVTAGGSRARFGDQCTRAGDAASDSWSPWRLSRPPQAR